MANGNDKGGRAISVTGIICAALCALLCIGAATVFGACTEPGENGWMTCHWAGQIEIWLGGVMTLIAVAGLFVDKSVKRGMDIALIPTALLAAFIPGNVVGLCMGAHMQCRAVMRPAVLVIGILIAAMSVADILVLRKKA